MNLTSLAAIHTELGKVNWNNIQEPGNVIADIDPDFLLDLYADALRLAHHELTTEGFSSRLHPKATHLKVCLDSKNPNLQSGPMLWLHDYSASGENSLLDLIDDCAVADILGQTGPQYVEAWHTHRHNFVSMRIDEDDKNFAFAEDRVSPADRAGARLNARGFWTPQSDEWQPVRRAYRRGDIMAIYGPTDIHRVQSAGRAITFLIQGPNQNGYSQTYKTGGEVDRIIPDIPTRFAERRARWNSMHGSA